MISRACQIRTAGGAFDLRQPLRAAADRAYLLVQGGTGALGLSGAA
jgi:hypothetical protein